MILKQKIARNAAVLMLVISGAALTACTQEAPDVTSDQIDALFSSQEQQEEIAVCLEDVGWDSKYDAETGSVTTSVPEEQTDIYNSDWETCAEAAGIDLSGTLGEEQFSAAYAWYEMIAVCLGEHGYSVPAQPSYATFKSTYESDPWLPWIEVPAEQMNDAREDCPELARPQS